MILKSLTRVTGFVVAAVAAALLLISGAGAANAASVTGVAAHTTTSAAPPPNQGGGGAGEGSASAGPSDETQAWVVGGVAFLLMIGTAGAVLWNTARNRHTPS